LSRASTLVFAKSALHKVEKTTFFILGSTIKQQVFLLKLKHGKGHLCSTGFFFNRFMGKLNQFVVKRRVLNKQYAPVLTKQDNPIIRGPRLDPRG